MDPIVRDFIAAMTPLMPSAAPRLARIKKIDRGLATLEDGLVVALPADAKDMKVGARVLLLPGPGNPRALKV